MQKHFARGTVNFRQNLFHTFCKLHFFHHQAI